MIASNRSSQAKSRQEYIVKIAIRLLMLHLSLLFHLKNYYVNYFDSKKLLLILCMFSRQFRNVKDRDKKKKNPEDFIKNKKICTSQIRNYDFIGQLRNFITIENNFYQHQIYINNLKNL